MRMNDTDKIRGIIIDRLVLTRDLGREAKASFVAKLGCNNLASTLPDAGEALRAEAKARWCGAVLKRLTREPMLAVLQDERDLLTTKTAAMCRQHNLGTIRQYTQFWMFEAYQDLYEMLYKFCIPRLDAAMSAENIEDSPWRAT